MSRSFWKMPAKKCNNNNIIIIHVLLLLLGFSVKRDDCLSARNPLETLIPDLFSAVASAHSSPSSQS